jgi:hypothetical protein
MSNRYKGGVISATPPTTTGGESGTASGAWTLEQQMQAQAAGLWPVAPPDPSLFIENLFSTFLYNGTSTTNPINNGIDLSTKGGLVWGKRRNLGNSHFLIDTARGASNRLESDGTGAQADSSAQFPSFNSNGFTVATADNEYNNSAGTYCSWTFRKQPKFFDVLTYTGTGSNTTIAHSLGSVPGCIIVKRTDTTAAWAVYHRSLANTQYLVLNTSAVAATGATWWNSTTPTSSVFSVGTDASVNASGGTYVAYVFAHDAGGFGLTGTDNVISCGSFTTDGSAKAVVDLGYEPQWILHKRDEAGEDWRIADNMRGWQSNGTFQRLEPNTADAEANTPSNLGPTATGFETFGNAGASKTFIYIAIRRGPMKVPTSGTSVFAPIAATASTNTSRTVGFPADMTLSTTRTISDQRLMVDRLRGYANTNSATPPTLDTTSTAAEVVNTSATVYNVWNTTALDGPYSNTYSTVWWHFRRAPGFFDEVICTQTGSAQNVTHNLGVAPELLILKDRTSAVSWQVGTQFTSTTWNNLVLNNTDAGSVGAYNNYINAQPTSTVFRLGSSLGSVNDSFVAYLFATCAGVSKVGSYTGTATTLQIDCGFTAGSRFVLIKRTDSTGDWYVWDSARGIVAGNDPYLLLNSTAAEVTNTDYVDTYNAGFEISSTAPAGINASAGTYIFLAIA